MKKRSGTLAESIAEAVRNWQRAGGAIDDEFSKLLLDATRIFVRQNPHTKNLNPHTHEDIAGNAVVSILKMLEKKQPQEVDPNGFTGYIKTVCNTAVSDYYKNANRKNRNFEAYSRPLRKILHSDPADPGLLQEFVEFREDGSIILAGSMRDIFTAAINECSPINRPALQKIFLDPLNDTYGTLSDLLPETPEPTTKGLVRRGLTELKEKLPTHVGPATKDKEETVGDYISLLELIYKARFDSLNTKKNSTQRNESGLGR